MARSVRFDLIADADKFSKGMRQAQKSSESFTHHTSNAGKALKAATAAFSVGVVVNQMKNWVAAARDSNKTAQQTATVLKSTHGAAGLTADQFAKLASQISKTTAVDDDLIQGGENMIATFTKIHGDVFKKTTQAAVDMTAAMNHGEVTQEGLKGSSILLGKALNDPLRGLSALTRVGVTFSEQQRQQIADFVKHGQTAKAQGIILAEVNKEFGGSAAAAVTPAKQLAVTWGNMQEVLGNLLIPAIDKGAKILAGILGVVDRNRTAFGVLFGVLGTGAAIIGTLVVAEKVHAAVTDGVKAATAAWSAVQKGMNVVLGATKVQALAAAEAETGLAASTAAAGASSRNASIGLAGAVPVVGALTVGFVASKKAIKDNVSTFDELRSMLGLHVKKIDDAKAATAAAAQAHVKLAADASAAGVAESTLAGKTDEQAAATVAAAAKTKDLSAKLREQKLALQGAVGGIRDVILGYDGLISKSKVGAKQVIADLHTQTANFKTFSADTQRLLKAGFSSAAIQELATKGPQYVHALATGSDKQLRIAKQAFHDRGKEIHGDFQTTMQRLLDDLTKKIRSMQREINKLKGKTVVIKANAHIDPNVLQTFVIGNVRRQAAGGLVTGPGGPTDDRIPALLSSGEFVVNAKAVRELGASNLERLNTMRFATGGMVGRDLDRFTSSSTRALGTGTRNELNKAMRQFGGTGGNASVAAIAARTVALLHRSFSEIGAWSRRILFESGGNWSAVNRTDSNWLAGHPSVGGAQVIRGTFARWAGPFRAVGPFAYGVSENPLANSYAGANYAIHQYGSLAAVDPRIRPIGYDQGGMLPPGLSMAYNGTGRPEPVGGGMTVNVTIAGSFYGQGGVDQLAAQIQTALLRRKRNSGGINLGLT